eukprot:8877804-Pyramimonas_sp.AAC.1
METIWRLCDRLGLRAYVMHCEQSNGVSSVGPAGCSSVCILGRQGGALKRPRVMLASLGQFAPAEVARAQALLTLPDCQ